MINLKSKEFEDSKKMKSNFTNTLQTLIVNGLIIIINLGTGIITARFLGVEGRGNQAAMIMLPQFLAYMMTFGLPVSVIYNMRKNKGKMNEIVSTSVTWALLIGIISSIVGYLLIPVFLNQYSEEVIRFSQYVIFLTPLGLLSTICTPILKVSNEYSIFNRMRYVLPALTLIILVVLIIFDLNNAYTFAIAYMLPGLPVTIWLLIKIYKMYGYSLGKFRENTRMLFSYGIRAYGIDIIGTLYSNLNQMLLTVMFSPVFLGYYVVSNSIANMLNIFQNAVVEVLFPSTAGKEKTTVINVAARSARCSSYLTFSVAIIIFFTCPLLIRLMYGIEFLEATNLLRILLIAIVISSTNWILSQVFLSLNRPGVITIIQSLGIGITIPLFILLVNKYGLIGSGFAIFFSNLFRLIFTLICYKFILKVQIPNIIFDRNDFKYIYNKISNQIRIKRSQSFEN